MLQLFAQCNRGKEEGAAVGVLPELLSCRLPAGSGWLVGGYHNPLSAVKLK